MLERDNRMLVMDINALKRQRQWHVEQTQVMTQEMLVAHRDLLALTQLSAATSRAGARCVSVAQTGRG